jgi:cell division protein FtsL
MEENKKKSNQHKKMVSKVLYSVAWLDKALSSRTFVGILLLVWTFVVSAGTTIINTSSDIIEAPEQISALDERSTNMESFVREQIGLNRQFADFMEDQAAYNKRAEEMDEKLERFMIDLSLK